MKILVMLSFFFLSVHAAKPAKVLQGYKRHMASTYMTYEGVLQEYLEEGRNFFIQIEGKAGLYRFPKTADATDVRKFLEDAKKQKKKIKLEVNIQTAEISTLGE